MDIVEQTTQAIWSRGITPKTAILSQKQTEIVYKALDYMASGIKKQERVISPDDMYGDGTIFVGLTREGFYSLYECYIYALKESGVI